MVSAVNLISCILDKYVHEGVGTVGISPTAAGGEKMGAEPPASCILYHLVKRPARHSRTDPDTAPALQFNNLPSDICRD
jgi:hypothetical protein